MNNLNISLLYLLTLPDWLSFSAKTVTCQTDCIAIVVNWGTFSGKDYACIVANMIQPFGNFLGKIFCKLGPSKIFISGHSLGEHKIHKFNKYTKIIIKFRLGAHIGGFASKYVKNNCGIIREMAGDFIFKLLFNLLDKTQSINKIF